MPLIISYRKDNRPYSVIFRHLTFIVSFAVCEFSMDPEDSETIRNIKERKGYASLSSSDDEKSQESSNYEDSDYSPEELQSSESLEAKTPYHQSSFVYFCNNRPFFHYRSTGCRPARGQYGGSTYYPRCCPCYNKHFRCCLPGIINKPQPYCIIPVKKCPPQKYVPNKLRKLCKCKTKIEKKEYRGLESKESVEPEEPEETEESKEEVIIEEIVEPKPEPLLEVAPARVERETEIQQPYFCLGAIPTQTSTPLIKLLDRKRNVMVDTPIPIQPPCLRVILRGVFDASCSTADVEKRPKGCNFKDFCRCTGAYIEREMIVEDEFFQNGGVDLQRRKCLECPCLRRGCRGSCGYQEDGRKILGIDQTHREKPCIPNCGYYNIKATR